MTFNRHLINYINRKNSFPNTLSPSSPPSFPPFFIYFFSSTNFLMAFSCFLVLSSPCHFILYLLSIISYSCFLSFHFNLLENFFIRNMISFQQTDQLSLDWVETQNIYTKKDLTSNCRYLPPKLYNQKFPWHAQPEDEQLCCLPCG